MDDDMGFLQDKLQNGISSTAPEDIQGALSRTFSVAPPTLNPQGQNTPQLQGTGTNIQVSPSLQGGAQNTPNNLQNNTQNKALTLQMTNPQQQTDQSQPLKLNFGQPNQDNQQSPQLSTQLVNYNKPIANLQQTTPTNVPVPTYKPFNIAKAPTPQENPVERFLAPAGHAVAGLAGQVVKLTKSVVPSSYNISGGALSFNPKQVEKGVKELRPAATQVRQIAQSFPQEGVRLAKTVLNPGTNTKPVASKNPVTKFLVGNQPVESYQQLGHNAPGGTAGKAGSIVTQGIGDVLNLLGAKAAIKGGINLATKPPEVPEVPVETPVPEATDPDIKNATQQITKIAQNNNVKPVSIKQTAANLPAEEDVARGTKITPPASDVSGSFSPKTLLQSDEGSLSPKTSQPTMPTPNIKNPNLPLDQNTFDSMVNFAKQATSKNAFVEEVAKKYWQGAKDQGVGDLAGGYKSIIRTLKNENGLDVGKLYDQVHTASSEEVPTDTLTTTDGKSLSFEDFNKVLTNEDPDQLQMFTEGKTPSNSPSIREAQATRDPQAEWNALQVLYKEGSTRDDAVQQYMQDTGVSRKSATYSVSRAARDARAALKPNPRIANPEEGQHDLPTAKSGDFNRANINKQIVDTVADSKLRSVNKALGGLSSDDRANFEDYLEKTKPIEDADDPEAVQDAINKGLSLTDAGNALDHAVGGNTPHIQDYFPGYTDRSDLAMQDSLQAEADLENQYGTDWYRLTKDQQHELIAERLASESKSYPDDENFGGFRNQARQFATRAERQAAGVKDLYDDPRDSYTRYANGLKFKIGNDAFTKAAQEADQANQMAGSKIAGKINLGAGKDTGNLTDKAYNALKDNDVNAGTKNPIIKLNTGIKKILIGTSSPHAIIIPPRYIGARLMLGADTTLRTLFNDPSLDNINKLNDPSDIAEFGSRVDSSIHGGRYTAGVAKRSLNPLTRLVYDKFLPAMHASLLRGLKNFLDSKGISYDSDIARNYGHQINDVMGYSKLGNNAFDQLTFAPSLIKSTVAMYGKAATPTGLIARGGVLGQQIVNESLTFLSRSISNQISQNQGKPQNKTKDDFWSTFIEGQEGKVYTPFRNSKGEQIMLSIPGQYEDKPLQIAGNVSRGGNGQLKIGPNNPSQIVSNTVQTAKDIASPIVNAGLSAATGKSYNNTQVRNPYAPLGTQAAQTGINIVSNALPINLQGVISSNVQKHLPETLQGAIQVSKNSGSPLLGLGAQTLGLTPEANQTTGSGPAIQKYYAGQTSGQDYIAAHSDSPQTQSANETAFSQYYARAKNDAGQTILLGPRQSAANSALVASNPTVLAGIQIAEKANGKGNYNPIYDLPTTATSGKPSLQTYMTYEALPKGDPNRTVMEQKNPWLINEFNKEQTYFNQSTYKSTAVAGPGYVAYPNISSSQSDMMTQVTQLASNKNRTPAQETQLENLENNPQLQAAYTLLDNYTNANRRSEGLAPIPYPTENMTPAQQQLLAQEEALPSGTGQKSALITANQAQWNALTQIMADSTQYAIEEYGGVVQQGGTEPDLLKDESNIDQDIAVGTNTTTGQKEYQLNPALAYSGGTQGGFTFAQGSGSGGSGSSSSSNPLVPLPKVKRGKLPKMRKPPKLHGFRAPHIKKQQKVRVQANGNLHAVQVARPTSVVRLKAA